MLCKNRCKTKKTKKTKCFQRESRTGGADTGNIQPSLLKTFVFFGFFGFTWVLAQCSVRAVRFFWFFWFYIGFGMIFCKNHSLSCISCTILPCICPIFSSVSFTKPNIFIVFLCKIGIVPLWLEFPSYGVTPRGVNPSGGGYPQGGLTLR